MSRVTTVFRLLLGMFLMAACVVVFVPLLVLLIPSRRLRIRVGNHFGHVAGRACLWAAGVRVDPAAAAATSLRRPAIYVSNHVSILDIFVGIWLAPLDTCGVGKKEVIWYPFFGQLYWLSGHLRIDRGHRERAIEGMRETAERMRAWGLGAWIWPEGTRSADGRLLPFKKGFAHLALATKLPIVPVVVENAHHRWPKTRLEITPGPLTVRVLPSIDTTGWTLDGLDAHIAEVRQVFLDALPPEQRPLEGEARTAS